MWQSKGDCVVREPQLGAVAAGAPLDAGPAEPSQLQRGLRILELLTNGPQSAASIARELDIHRSTALRLLRELESTRYVRRNAEKEYALVLERILALVPDGDEHSDLIETINPILRQVRDEYREAVNFSVPAEGVMVYASYYPSPHVVSLRERAGTVRPMYCSAIGKAYLSALSLPDVDEYLGRLRFSGGTERAPRGPLELREHLEASREHGYALDLQETLPTVVCVAVPVCVGGVAIGAAGISAPLDRMPDDRIVRYGERLRELFDELARQTKPPRA
jgi:DNA-binding IclR family transcriptional regulator